MRYALLKFIAWLLRLSHVLAPQDVVGLTALAYNAVIQVESRAKLTKWNGDSKRRVATELVLMYNPELRTRKPDVVWAIEAAVRKFKRGR